MNNTYKFKHLKKFSIFLVSVLLAGFMLSGCGEQKINKNSKKSPVRHSREVVNVPSENTRTVELDVEDEAQGSGRMVSYDVLTVGRADPFMPFDEIQAYDEARNSAIAEANAYNSEIAKIKKLQNVAIREPDDISPYSFNLPVPPTKLGGENSYASKITKTKVVGIMYNAQSPSAIINVDQKDYLVRIGDKIIGQEYKVVKINPTWITVSMGSNVYSAAVGELFSKDELSKNQNDIYNLKNRFGGRRG
ncbi:hypothetical protein J6G99_06915 [bacterium]|nr:hypothetical protein [bacterium]